MMRPSLHRLLPLLAMLCLGAGMCAVTSPRGIQPAHYTYREARPLRDPDLLQPGPAPLPPDPPPATDQRYPTAAGALQVWLQRPSSSAALLPVVVYLHDGVALTAGELSAVAPPFLAAGYALVVPTWRGENGNPGAHALLYGEVDDARAAVAWAAQQPGLDGRRMFALGHGTGGVIAAMLSLYPELPLLATASVSAMFPEAGLSTLGVPLPFRDTPPARQIRVFPPFFGQVAAFHIAYVGEQDAAIAPHRDRLEAAAEKGGGRVNLLWMPGDRDSIRAPAIAAFLQQIGD